jgi:pyruvyltransferase
VIGFIHKVINWIKFKIRSYKRERIARRFIFSDLDRPVVKNRVNLHYWRYSQQVDNVGDLFSKVVVEFMLKKENINPKSRIRGTHHLMAIGSILNHAKHKTVVWGAGIHDHKMAMPDVSFDIRAVRGPVSRKILIKLGYNCPEVYGDPAMLLPDFFNPGVKKMKEYIIIPHYSKEKKYLDKHDNVITTITSDWKTFIKSILEANMVISSSLHGLIIAEAYNIPAILLEDIDQDYLKYNDYYFSTGRKQYKKAKTVEEAIKIGREPIPDFTSMKKGLYKSFPYDLWL